jgi:hypothetical protein
MNLHILRLYADIIKQLSEKSIDPVSSMLTGYISLTDELLVSLKALLASNLCSGSISFYEDDDFVVEATFAEINSKHFAYKAKIELTTKKEHGKFFICKNWDTLLSYEKYVKNPIEAVYFIGDYQLISSNDNNSTFNNYQNVAKVYQLLESVAVASSGTSNLVIYERALSLTYQLKKTDLEHSFDTEALERFLDKDLHHEAKVSLVCKALVAFLSSTGESLRFGYLISHFNAFSMDLSLSYQNYVDNYTFDKVRKEYQEKHTLYVERVNDVFDGAVAKLLTMPAGVWFAITQIQSYQVGNLAFIKNIAVLISVFILASFLILNLLGQFGVLDTISKEYKGLFNRLKDEYPQEQSEIMKVLDDIDEKSTWVYIKLYTSLFSAVVLVGLAFILMYNAGP